MVKEELIKKQIKELRTYLKQLERYQPLSVKEIEEDLEKAWIVERGLQLAVQLILDIGNHILSEEGEMVENYREIFEKLVKLQVLPEKFADKIKGMAGFRNILLHDYREIDKEIVAQVLNNSLEDFHEFVSYVDDYLKENSS